MIRRIFDDSSNRHAFESMLEGNGISIQQFLIMLLKTPLDPVKMIVTHLPGPSGFGLRRLLYKKLLRKVGINCIFDTGLKFTGMDNISVDDYTWIDSNTSISAMFGPVSLGKRIHVAPGCIINAGSEGVILEDYVGLSSGVHIYGHSEAPKDGKRMSGPMIPWRFKAFTSGQVRVCKDAFIGAYSVVLPGVTIGEGAVIGAHSLVTKDVKPWTISLGVPARVIGERSPVTVPEI
jgi:acetyltransferase-like isoleucine patch superfamily enzyme